jgi:hypothetical protein
MKRDETRREIGYYIAFVTGVLTPIQKAKRSRMWCISKRLTTRPCQFGVGRLLTCGYGLHKNVQREPSYCVHYKHCQVYPWELHCTFSTPIMGSRKVSMYRNICVGT